MPKPQGGETRKEFVSRCIPIVIDDGTAKDPDQAVAICNSIWEQEKGRSNAMPDNLRRALTAAHVPRVLTLRQIAGELRTAKFEDRDHLIVPVIMLVEGVIQPANASGPELVLAEELAQFAVAWSGRPVTFTHPIIDGQRVSANTPSVLEEFRFGRVFGTRMLGKKLRGDAWLDLALAAELGGDAQNVVDRIQAGEMIEVSVGAFVVLEETPGVFHGHRYHAIWREIVSDHLAMFGDSTIGACDNEMGCGAPLVAQNREPLLQATDAGGLIGATDDTPSAGAPMARAIVEGLKTLRERFSGGVTFFFKNAQGEGDVSDSELRSILDSALFETEPAFLGIEDVFPADQIVIYATVRDGEIAWFSRTYEISESGDVSFGEPTEVRPVTRFEPVAAATACSCEDPAACHCGFHTGERDMDKAQHVTALIENEHSPFTEADQAALEAMSDDSLTALEASATDKPAPDPVPDPAPAHSTAPAPVAPVEEREEEPEEPEEPVQAESVDDWLTRSGAPPEVRDVWQERQAAEADRKETLVGLLKAAQKHYDEDALKKMSIVELEGLAAVSSAEVPPADFSGIAMPRSLDRSDEGTAPEPKGMIGTFRAAADAKNAAATD